MNGDDAAATWDRRLEWLICGLVAGAVVVAVLGFGAVRLSEFMLVEGLIGLALAAWVVRLWTPPRAAPRWPPACWAVLAVTAWAAWRHAVADVEYAARGELLRLVNCAALFLIIVGNLRRPATLLAPVGILLALGTGLVFLAAHQFVTASDTVWGLARGGQYGRRAGATFINPNHFAGFLALLIPVAAALAIAGRLRPVWRVLVSYAAAAMLGGLALTMSRGGLAAAAAGLLVVFALLLARREHRRVAAIGLVLLLGAGAVAGVLALRDPQLKRRLSSGFHEDEVVARNSRQQIWPAAVAMWRDHAVWGVGPGHFPHRFNQYRTKWVHGDPQHAHNDYLETLAEWGVAGSVVLALPGLLLLAGAWRAQRRLKPGRSAGDGGGNAPALLLGTAGGLAALAVHGLTDFNFRIPANALVASAWAAVLAGISHATVRPAAAGADRWHARAALTVLLLAGLGVLGWDLSRRGREAVHRLRAERQPAVHAATFRELQAAWAVEPRNAQTAYDLGEVLRLRALQEPDAAEARLRAAAEWFRRAAELNPHQRANHLGLGRVCSLLGERAEAERALAEALRVDPNGRITSFFLGWHAFSVGDYAAAWDWFAKSSSQGWPAYEPAQAYLRLMREHGLMPR